MSLAGCTSTAKLAERTLPIQGYARGTLCKLAHSYHLDTRYVLATKRMQNADRHVPIHPSSSTARAVYDSSLLVRLSALGLLTGTVCIDLELIVSTSVVSVNGQNDAG